MVSFNFAPKGWAQCNGQLLPINQNQALFSLLGTTYGGDGRVNFGLPDMRGRAAVHIGNGIVQGEKAGEEAHTLTAPELPAHTHPLQGATDAADSPKPGGHLLATTAGNLTIYAPFAHAVNLAPASISNVGGSQPHSNQSPFIVLNWIIALQGIFPSRN